MAPPVITQLRNYPDAAFFLVLGAAVVSFAINIYCLLIGITIVVSHLLYIPIILAAFFFPRRGVAVSVGIAVVYFSLVALLRIGYTADLISAGARCIVFVIIAAVVSYLSGRVNERERDLVRAKEEWERTFNAVPDLIALIDREHRILRINKAMARIAGITPEQAVGMRCYEVVHRSGAPPPDCPHTLLMRDGLAHTSEVQEKIFGGDFVVTTSPLTGSDGAVIGCVHIAHEITERRRAEQAIIAANKKLNILSSITRHDILNKITALFAFLDLSRERVKDPVIVDYIGKEIAIINAIRRQIEFTRYYQDIGVKRPEWQEVSPLIRGAAGQLPMEAIALTVDVGALSLYADPLLEKVFYNLMENAIRHGGHVSAITFSASETSEGLILTCRDNGTGIEAEIKEKIFDRGFGKHTGLGLFLIREILSITGITITENGEYGKGATFEIRVPKGAYRLPKTP